MVKNIRSFRKKGTHLCRILPTRIHIPTMFGFPLWDGKPYNKTMSWTPQRGDWDSACHWVSSSCPTTPPKGHRFARTWWHAAAELMFGSDNTIFIHIVFGHKSQLQDLYIACQLKWCFIIKFETVCEFQSEFQHLYYFFRLGSVLFLIFRLQVNNCSWKEKLKISLQSPNSIYPPKDFIKFHVVIMNKSSNFP